MKRLEKTRCTALEALLAGKKARLPDAGGEILYTFLAFTRAQLPRPRPQPDHLGGAGGLHFDDAPPIPPHHAQIIMALDDVWMRDPAAGLQDRPGQQPRRW